MKIYKISRSIHSSTASIESDIREIRDGIVKSSTPFVDAFFSMVIGTIVSFLIPQIGFIAKAKEQVELRNKVLTIINDIETEIHCFGSDSTLENKLKSANNYLKNITVTGMQEFLSSELASIVVAIIATVIIFGCIRFFRWLFRYSAWNKNTDSKREKIKKVFYQEYVPKLIEAKGLLEDESSKFNNIQGIDKKKLAGGILYLSQAECLAYEIKTWILKVRLIEPANHGANTNRGGSKLSKNTEKLLLEIGPFYYVEYCDVLVQLTNDLEARYEAYKGQYDDKSQEYKQINDSINVVKGIRTSIKLGEDKIAAICELMRYSNTSVV